MTPSRSAKCCKYEYSVRENESFDLLILYKVAIKYSFYEKNRDVLLRGKSLFNRDDFVQLGDILLFTGVFQSCRFNGYSVCMTTSKGGEGRELIYFFSDASQQKPVINVDLSYAAAINSSVSVSINKRRVPGELLERLKHTLSFQDSTMDRGICRALQVQESRRGHV